MDWMRSGDVCDTTQRKVRKPSRPSMLAIMEVRASSSFDLQCPHR
jgi:hypothetical protein